MNDRLKTTREALLAELLGDMHALLERVDETAKTLRGVDEHARATALRLDEANRAYRAQLDDLVARLRVEFAGLVAQVTEHAARSLVGQQTEVLQHAATSAIRQAITAESLRRARHDWFRLVMAGAGIGALIASVVLLAGQLLLSQ